MWDSKPSDPDQPINWVELKTSAEISNDRDSLKFERKLLKFWIQSFLLGVPKIVVGFRDKNGLLMRLEEIETKTIPGNVKRRGRKSWDGNICINFTAAFLECEYRVHELLRRIVTGRMKLNVLDLRATVTGRGVWRIRRRRNSPVVEIFKIKDDGHDQIISQEFLDWRLSQSAANAE